MKARVTVLIACLCASTYSAAAADLSKSLPTVLKTIAEAMANCPDPHQIAFKAGLPAPGPLGKVSYLTADFTGSKGNTVFANSEKDGFCPIGTKNPRAYENTDDLIQAKKDNATPCLVMPIPAITAASMVQDIELSMSNNNGYGTKQNGKVHCNYKYKSNVLDPDTSHPLEGFVILSSH